MGTNVLERRYPALLLICWILNLVDSINDIFLHDSLRAQATLTSIVMLNLHGILNAILFATSRPVKETWLEVIVHCYTWCRIYQIEPNSRTIRPLPDLDCHA
jgi:hypothetical protein